MKKPCRVLLLAPQPFYQERGTPMNVRLMCTVLGRAGYAVDLLVFPTGQQIEIPGVRIICLPNVFRCRQIPIGFSLAKLLLDGIMIPYAIWLCLKNRYTVIHGIEEGGVVAVLLSKLFFCKSVFDMDSVLSTQFAQKGALIRGFLAGMERFALKYASLVLTVCAALSNHAREVTQPEKIVQIEDIPLDFAFPVEKERQRETRALVEQALQDKQLAEKQLFLYTGNLQSYQGIDLLLAAWSIASQASSMAQARLVIVGGNEQDVLSYRAQASSAAWGDSTVFMGQRPAEEMGAWMECATCLVSPRAEGENTPLKIYSYMSSGKPIVATDILSHTQVLTAEIAFLVSPEPEAMAHVFQGVVDQPETAAQIGLAAQKVVQDCFGYEVFSSKLLDGYGLLTGKIG